MTHTLPRNDTGPHTAESVVGSATRIAREFAAPNAGAVDRDSRFPFETFEALRNERMLSLLIPEVHGGSGASLQSVAQAIEILARSCASSAMVYTMHHIQVASLVRHGRSPWCQEFQRTVAADELLLASATTEKGTGGDVRSSICAVEYDGDCFTLTKDAPVVSYGAHADAIFATARRCDDSPASDQVLVVMPIDDVTLEHRSGWNALGFRGTCSDGYIVRGSGSVEQLLADSYADISARTMLPTSHTLWASVWLGLATSAVDAARAFVRAQARTNPDVRPPGAVHLATLVGDLEEFRALVGARVTEYEAVLDDDDASSSMGFALRMNSLKISASNYVVDIVTSALRICGIAGYLEDTPYSLGRHLRDAHGAALMVSNDRLIGASAQMLLVHKEAR